MRRATSVMSSMSAVISGATDSCAPEVPSRYSVPRSAMKLAGSNSSPTAGVTASRTRGSARASNARRTPPQTPSRCRGSAVDWASSSSAQPGAAPTTARRIRTGSWLAGARVQPSTVRASRPSSAAACSRARTTAWALAAQKSPSVTLRPTPAASTSARARRIATSGSAQPRTGDQRSPSRRPASRCGSKIATGPTRSRCATVVSRLSVLVDGASTAPGASRMAGMTRCTPFPARGGAARR